MGLRLSFDRECARVTTREHSGAGVERPDGAGTDGDADVTANPGERR